MFVNAGMVPFKDLFTGRDKRAYKRATSSQKCMRISGKHNDLENVGRTARHHTFFEMLGNFSFGDYFKADAIAFAWELLTKVYCLPKERLVITVFGGEGDVPADEEARSIWKKVTGFGDDRIFGLGSEDNFWRMGDTGPCGPCSEIHFYHGDRSPDPARFGDEPSPDGTGWVELWNLVFMQFDRTIIDGQARLARLPAPSIDTGAGLERIAGALQHVRSNYDTDLLRPLVAKAAQIAKKRYTGTMSDDDVSMRVIADHARATAFLIAEGVLPDRTTREYVLRRVMRRAIRHGHRLGIERPFLHEVALEVVAMMGDQYRELVERKDLIASVAEQEEVRFRQTIDRGLKILDDEFAKLRDAHDNILAGDTAFRLYDTYGFPIDLTDVICNERGLAVDMPGYERAIAARKQSDWVAPTGAVDEVYRLVLKMLPAGGVRFVGYESECLEGATVAALVRDGRLVDAASQGERVEVVLDATPFYGESGGQSGDRGVLRSGSLEIEVTDTQKPFAGAVVHVGLVKSGAIKKGDSVRAEVDHAGRRATRRAHSATHLLHYALRRALGEQAQQKGSLVEPDRLRFDFTWGKAMSPEEKERVEDLVNEKVLLNAPITTEVLPIEEAKKRGAMAIFEEKYGDVVRMLTMTSDSVELCGGTHASATGDIGLFKILSEAGVAAGVRRIEAVTGMKALKQARCLESTVNQAASLVRSSGGELVDKVEKLVTHAKELDKKVADLTRKLAMGGGGSDGDVVSRAHDIDGIKVLGMTVEVADPAALRELAEKVRDKLGNSVVLIATTASGKVQLVVAVSKALLPKLRAGDIIKPISQVLGGSGGGRPDMAQAGGTEVGKLDEAIALFYRVVETSLTKAPAGPAR